MTDGRRRPPRRDEALAGLDRALELNPTYAWARERRDAVVRDRDG
ncbi:hypothetical protein ACWIFK_26305 [Streptomyces althioticus]